MSLEISPVESSEAIWIWLANNEPKPMYAWRDSYDLAQIMCRVVARDGDLRRLIETYAPSRSVTYAAAVFVATCERMKELEKGKKLDWFLLYFEHLRLRTHMATMGNLVSKISFLVQVEGVREQHRAQLLELCSCALEFYESVEPRPQSVGLLEDILARTELIVEHGLAEAMQESAELWDLVCWLQRARAMATKLAEDYPVERLVKDSHTGPRQPN